MSGVSSLFALLAGTALFVCASGLLGTALALTAAEAGLPEALTGMVMAAYFLGFIVGTYVCPKVVARVGHIRAFSVFASSAAAAVLAHALVFDALVWGVLRFVTGVAVVGLYMVLESWLNEKSEDANRGKVFAAYQIVSLLSLGLGQWFLLFEYSSYVTPMLVCGALLVLGVIPISLTRVVEPAPVPAVRFDPRRLRLMSPVGVVGTFMAAVANGALFALGPVFAMAAGLSTQMVALFMSCVILGGLAMQWPIGHYSDRHDRRTVVFAVASLATVSALVAALTAGHSAVLLFAAAFVYGGFTFSLYPLCVAHSNDQVPREDLVPTATSLLFLYGVGATIAPAFLGLLMGRFGHAAFFLFLAASQALLTTFVLYRKLTHEPADVGEKEPFALMNRTSQAAIAMLSETVDHESVARPVEQSDVRNLGS